MKITLQTIAPFHIGNGEELQPVDYAVYDKYYHRISQQTILDFLKQNPAWIEQYADWMNDTAEKIEELDSLKKGARGKQKEDYNQQLNSFQNSFNVISFSSIINQKDAFLRHLKAAKNGYKIPYNGRLKGNVRPTIKTATDHPYIPGSSLKGAIRTALLYQYLAKYADTNEIKETLNELLKKAPRNHKEKKKYKKTFADQLEHLAFYCAIQMEGEAPKTNDEKFDILKLLKVSDGQISGTPTTTMRLADVKLYLVKKDKKRGSDETEIKARQQGQTNFVEAISEGTTVTFNISIDLNFLLQFCQQFEQNEVKVKNKKYWIGIKEKVKNAFGIDLDQWAKELKAKPMNYEEQKAYLEKKEQEVINYIFGAVRDFNQKQVEHQKMWLDNFIKMDADRTYKKSIENGHEVLFANTDKRLIHLGFGTGFTGITEYLYLLNNPELEPILKQILEYFGIGDKMKKRDGASPYIANPDRFPKSRRLVYETSRIQPMGWACLFAPSEEVKTNTRIITAVQVEYFKGTLNPKKRPQMDAEVIHSGKPNKVKVFVSKDYTPEVKLDRSSNPLEVGKIVIVEVGVSKKKQITQASFVKEKK